MPRATRWRVGGGGGIGFSDSGSSQQKALPLSAQEGIINLDITPPCNYFKGGAIFTHFKDEEGNDVVSHELRGDRSIFVVIEENTLNYESTETIRIATATAWALWPF